MLIAHRRPTRRATRRTKEWAVVFTLTADEPLRVAVFIEDAAEIAWGLVDKDASSTAGRSRTTSR